MFLPHDGLENPPPASMPLSQLNLNYHLVVFAHVLTTLIGATSLSFCETLTEMRDWTSSDGKTLRAELLDFSLRQDPNTARFRVKDGAVFTLPISRFSRSDQAVLVKEHMGQSFRSEFSKRQDSCFFYSNHLAEDEWKNRSWAYVGSDIDSAWLRLAIYSEPGTFSDGNTIILIGDGAPLQILYSKEDIDADGGFRSTYEGIDTLITDQSNEFSRIVLGSNRLELYLEKSDGTIKQIPLSSDELSGLRSTASAFTQIAPLCQDHTWWATLINRSPEDFRAELSDPLLAWRDPNLEPSLAMQSWTNFEGETIEAELMGFERSQAILRDSNGELQAWPTTQFENNQLEQLAQHRLESSLEASWHPIEDHHQFYWPESRNPDARLSSACLLLAIDRRDETPRLLLQYQFEGDPEALPLQIDIEHEETSTVLQLPLEQPLKLRTSTGIVVWELLGNDQIDALLGLSSDAESLNLRGRSTIGEGELVQLSGRAFRSSLEALEIFRMIVHMKADPASKLLSSSDPVATELQSEMATSSESAINPEAGSTLLESELPPPVEEIFSATGPTQSVERN